MGGEQSECETFILKHFLLGSWLLLGVLLKQTFLCLGGLGVRFLCQSGADRLRHGGV